MIMAGASGGITAIAIAVWAQVSCSELNARPCVYVVCVCVRVRVVCVCVRVRVVCVCVSR